jgi:hypothetical protein
MPWTNTPPLAYMLEALRIAKEMEDQGVILTREQALALAHARIGPPKRWVAQEPTLTPKGREILDRIVAERERSHYPPGPTRGNSTSTSSKAAPERDRKPERPRSGASATASAPGPGRGRSRRRRRQQSAVRNVKITPLERFLADDGEDEDWTPA